MASSNGLLYNQEKAKVMTHSGKTVVVISPYRIQFVEFTRVTEIRDIGAIFDSSLRCHVDNDMKTVYAPLVSHAVFLKSFTTNRYFSCFTPLPRQGGRRNITMRDYSTILKLLVLTRCPGD